jgi:acyl transferase domain-containing protein/phosphopantetheinyl transferase (holo-ACP synthase)
MKPAKIAIIGMSCLFPGAPDLAGYWSNIVRGYDATREVSDKEWPVEDYYDADASTFGKSYSKRGGFITEFAQFDPLKYGVMPSTVAGSDPDQLLTLKVAQEAMADAGYLNRQFDRDRAEIIIGRISAPGAGCMNLVQQCKTVNEIAAILKGLLPDHNEELLGSIAAQVQASLVPVNSDTIPGAMPNVLAGRLAAKLGFRGRNMLIDAACASSMVAIETAVNDLLEKRCDFALAGGVHINSSAVFFQMFCGLGALSRNDAIRPFDQSADGTMLGEGVGMICLKRYEDAVRDGDRIYASICGVASSSDGHGGSVLAPSADGEALAMRKAYAMAEISPATVGLLEAHGTGTPTGDIVELQAVADVFNDKSIDRDRLLPRTADEYEPWCALGSVKSMIGHCQSASAVAGVIKAALSLHHKILPPTLNVTQPSTKIAWSKHPCYVNSQTRPWLRNERVKYPRRAAVSAFGFGGINGHAILEEREEDKDNDKSVDDFSLIHEWENELLTFSGSSRAALLDKLNQVVSYLSATAADSNSANSVVSSSLKDLAFTLNCGPESNHVTGGYRLAIIASSCQDLLNKLHIAAEQIADPERVSISEIKKGIHFTAPEALLEGKTAFLYPGLGSAYTNMLGDLCVLFPEIRAVFEIVDNVALAAGAKEPPSKIIFPAPFTNGERTGSPSLAAADFAVVAVLLAEYALHQFLLHLEIKPDVIMGCSTGEFAAITTGGSVDVLSVAQTFYELSTEVARSIPAESLEDLRSLRVLAASEEVLALVTAADRGEVHLSADLGDEHSIFTGSSAAIERLNNSLREKRLACHLLPVAIPYHTPLVHAVMEGNEEAVRAVEVNPLSVPAWSCSTGKPYPDDVEGIRSFFTELFTRPVALRQTVRSMYDAGVRKFIEVGPSGILSSLVGGILPDKPHLAVPTNLASKPGLTQIHNMLAALFVQEVPAKLDYLYQRRAATRVNWQKPDALVANRGPQLLLAHAPITVDATMLPLVKTAALSENLRHDYQSDEQDFHNEEQDYSSDDEQGENHVYEYEQEEVLAGDLNFSPQAQGAVVERFLNTNATFYNRLSAVSEQVMRSFISNESVGNEISGDSTGAYGDADLSGYPNYDEMGYEDSATDWIRQFQESATVEASLPSLPSLPFLNRCQIFQTAENTELFLTLNLATDLYLLDHAIGGTAGVVENTRVHLVPLMVSLEIMAEAAQAHYSRLNAAHSRHDSTAPNGVIVKLEQVKAFRRLVVDAGNLDLRLVVSGDANKLHVEMFDSASAENVLMMADYIFAEHYQAPKQPELKVSGSSPTVLTEHSKLYTPETMFHGPTMQSVKEVATVGNKCIKGSCAASPALNWIAESQASGQFLINPLLLDNASQFVLFYLYEKHLSATALLPFFIESVEFFSDPAALSPVVEVAATLPALSERATAAEVEVLDGGKVVLRVNSINSRRVMLNEIWQRYVQNPSTSWLGKAVETAESVADRCAIMQVSQDVLSDDDVILEWCLDYLLTKDELTDWRSQSQSKKRKNDWLLGRIAAKEAVRMLVKNGTGHVLGPHDIEIKTQTDRSPHVLIKDQDLPPILISISHTAGQGFALATFANAGKPGIDAEIVQEREADFATTFMQKSELHNFDKLPAAEKANHLTVVWAAKEAMYKANCGTLEASSFELIDRDNKSATNSKNALLVMSGKSGVCKTYLCQSGELIVVYTLSEPHLAG